MAFILGLKPVFAAPSPGQTTPSFFTHDPRRETEVKHTFPATYDKVQQAEVLSLEPLTMVRFLLDDLLFDDRCSVAAVVHPIKARIDSFHGLLEPFPTISSAFANKGELHYNVSPLGSPKQGESEAVSFDELLSPLLAHYRAFMGSLRSSHPDGCTALSVWWTTILQATLLFALWVTTMIIYSGCHFGLCIVREVKSQQTRLRVSGHQRWSFVPKRYKYAPGLPRRFATLSMVMLSTQFDSHICGGLIKLKPPKIRARPLRRVPVKGPDPSMTEFCRREYAVASIDGLFKAKTRPVGTYANFKHELFWRFNAPERARMASVPRWHARRYSLLSTPNPPMLSRNQGELLDHRSWLNGRWASGWNPDDALSSCPQIGFKLDNYSQDLPKDAVYGELHSKIEQAFGLRKAPIIEETSITKRLGLFAGSDPTIDPDWLVHLKCEIDDRSKEETGLVGMVVDTGASTCTTPNKDDFVGPIEYGNFGEVQTAEKGALVKIEGRGLVRWKAIDALGKFAFLECWAYYIPDMPIPLFSPQSYCQFHAMDKDDMYYGGNATSFFLKTIGGEALRFPIDGGSNLPFLLVKPDTDNEGCPTCHSIDNNAPCCRNSKPRQEQSATRKFAQFTVFDERNQNLTRSQKEILLWHHRLGHIAWKHLQVLMTRCTQVSSKVTSDCSPCINPKNTGAANCDAPLCAACELGRAHRKGSGAHKSKRVPDKINTVSGEKLSPGDVVSIDQYVCAVRGRLPFKRGREHESLRYCGGTIFLDHATGFVYVSHQVSFSAAATITAKELFEQEMARTGVKVKRYHTDNGIFKAAAFMDSLEEEQEITFSGVGAHWQNGVSERSIKTVTEKARAMMIHAAIHWPEEYNMNLWPFAMDYAAFLYNHTPTVKSGRAPVEKLCNIELNCKHINRARVWGCPAYVLDARLADGKRIPKWERKARLGQFLGGSTKHSSMIGLIRNLNTEYISPQWHVVYDELFTTVPSAGLTDRDLEAIWVDLFQTSRDYYGDMDSDREEDRPPPLHEDWLTDAERRARRRRNNQVDDADDDEDEIEVGDDGDEDDPDVREERCSDSSEQTPSLQNEESDTGSQLHDDIERTSSIPGSPIARRTRSRANEENETQTRTEPRRRLSRRANRGRRTEPTYADEYQEANLNVARSGYIGERWKMLVRTPSSKAIAFRAIELRCSADVLMMNLDWTTRATSSQGKVVQRHEEKMTDPITKEITYWHPLILAAKANQEDYPSLRDVLKMSQEDQDAWFKAMHEEMRALEEMGTFELVDREEAESSGKQIVPMTWALRQKRNPSGLPTRKKARCCLRGDLQEDISSRNDVYTPLVDWSTVRMLFGLAIHEGYVTKQVDFRLAFVQSPLPEPLYAELPAGGWKSSNPGKVMKFTRSIYGDRRSPQLWFKFLKAGLEARGWKASALDPCLYLRGDAIFTVYCDDGIFFAKTQKAIDEAVASLQVPLTDPQTGKELPDGHAFDLEYEDDLAGYLGVEIRRTDDGAMHLTQTHLTRRIIAALGLEDANPVATPATGPLHRMEDSPPRREAWNYRSVVGMMQYLCNNTVSEIAFAVNQVARYGNSPRHIHEQAVKRIGRYLKGTLFTDENGQERARGTIFKMTPEDRNKPLQVNCWADADFAGCWNAEQQRDPDTARSRTGYVISLKGFPIVWKSQMQTLVSLSTAEAEYAALCAAMRSLVPLRTVFYEVVDTFKIPAERVSLISHAYEDNEACLHVATADPPRLTARNKSWNVKHHWFREQLGDIKILPIASTDQLADVFTKALTQDLFEKFRKQLNGW